jgi:hypothetical protein
MNIFSPIEIVSEHAVLGLGHSERSEVGEFLARTLKNFGVFKTVDIVTTNDLAKLSLTQEISEMMAVSSVVTHSVFPVHMDRIEGPILQIIAFNPPEPTPTMQLAKGAKEVAADRMYKEPGHHTTGALDMAKAGIELLRRPLTSIETVRRIANSFSTLDYLIDHKDQFMHGRAVVHSSGDNFGFQEGFDFQRAEDDGIIAMLLGDSHRHNQLLFAPKQTLDLLPLARKPL